MADEYAEKIDMVSPVWYTILVSRPTGSSAQSRAGKEDEAGEEATYELSGGPTNAGEEAWLKRALTSKGDSKVEVVPRFYLDAWEQKTTPTSFQPFQLGSSLHRHHRRGRKTRLRWTCLRIGSHAPTLRASSAPLCISQSSSSHPGVDDKRSLIGLAAIDHKVFARWWESGSHDRISKSYGGAIDPSIGASG